jgi:hypothetical protein
MPALDFTEEEWRRPNLHREAIPGFGYRLWSAERMQWDVFSNDGKKIATISPDHERLTEGERRWYADYIKRHFGIDIGPLHNL